MDDPFLGWNEEEKRVLKFCIPRSRGSGPESAQLSSAQLSFDNPLDLDRKRNTCACHLVSRVTAEPGRDPETTSWAWER